jgi:hypothetical protein
MMVVGSLLFVGGCGADGHPPFVEDSPSGGASKPGQQGVGQPSGSGGSGEDDPVSVVPTIDDVYLFGPLRGEYGIPTGYAIAPVGAPNQYQYGFDTHEITATVRGDEIVYGFGLYPPPQSAFVFVPDLDGSPPVATTDYPNDTVANDVPIETTNCDAPDVMRWVVGSTGRFVYYCSNVANHRWFEDGQPLTADLKMFEALAQDDIAWFRSTDAHGILNIATGEFFPVAEIEEFELGYFERAHGAGFHLWTFTEEPGDLEELWEVDATGQVTKLGKYPDPPERVTFRRTTALAADDSLIEIVELDKDHWGLLRRTSNGSATVIYEETETSPFSLSDALLITGP